MVCKMAKPEEVLVVVNETGEAVREFMKDTDSIEQYFYMREILGWSFRLCDIKHSRVYLANNLASNPSFLQCT